MVTNPLEKVVVEEVDALLESVEAIRKEVSSDYHAELDEIKQNLDHYVNSDTAPWPEYRASVPWGRFALSFPPAFKRCYLPRKNLNIVERYTKKSMICLVMNHSTLWNLKARRINFIGDAKRVARLLDSFPRHGLSVVETNHGGTVLNLGDKFQAVKTKKHKSRDKNLHY